MEFYYLQFIYISASEGKSDQLICKWVEKGYLEAVRVICASVMRAQISNIKAKGKKVEHNRYQKKVAEKNQPNLVTD